MSSRTHRTSLLTVAAVVAGLAAVLAPGGSASAAHRADAARRGVVVRTTARQITVGNLFEVRRRATASLVRVYRPAGVTAPITGVLWRGHRALARATFPATGQAGWQTTALSRPVTLRPHHRYVVGYVTGPVRYAVQSRVPQRHGPVRVLAAKIARGAAQPRRTSHHGYQAVRVVLARRSTGGGGSGGSGGPSQYGNYPGSGNTGVPAGTRLSAYTGPMTITRPGTVIARKVVNGPLFINAPGVVIRKSQLNGRLDSDRGGSVTVTDSRIDGGNQQTFPAVSYSNLTLERVEVVGGQHSVQCEHTCSVLDSWLHDQYLPPGSAGHVNAFISNGGSNFVVRHSTLLCSPIENSNGGGCSGDLSLFGDFAHLSNATIDNNLFLANPRSISYCLYAGYTPGKPYGADPTRIVVTDNVFERGANNRCGMYGPVTSFLNANGNVWSHNTWWQQGTAIAPSQ